MENLVTIVEVGAYSERQYQKQDGTTEYFKSRGVVMKRGGDVVYGEMTGELASKNRDTQYYQNQPYIVKGFWKHRTWCRHFNDNGFNGLDGLKNDYISREHTFFSGSSLHKGRVLGASEEA